MQIEKWIFFMCEVELFPLCGGAETLRQRLGEMKEACQDISGNFP
jgi:hypothetical protein